MDFSRVGKFSVQSSALDHSGFSAIQMAMGRVFITSAIHNLSYGRFDYIGVSPLFRKIKHTEVVPEYQIVVKTDGSTYFEEI